MKTTHKNRTLYFVPLYLVLSLCTVLSSCQKKASSFNLEGECKILSLTMDEKYNAVINGTNRSVVVPIPETYNEENMVITSMTLSDGATASVAKGAHLNMSTAQLIRVSNGQVFQEYMLSVRHDEARILSFVLNDQYTGVINESAHTITVQVPVGTKLTALVPTVKISEGATLSPASGVPCDFTSPVPFVVTCNTASYTYTVTVSEMVAPQVLYVGIPATQQQLCAEEQEACSWLLANVEKSAYASFADIAAGEVDLSECKVIWWHFHKDGGIDSKSKFEANAAEMMPALDTLKAYYQNGGAFFLTRYATYLPAYLGEADCIPNNCWGQNEDNAETVGGPWEFAITGHTDHPMWQNLLMNAEAMDHVYTCNAGYRITNSTAQYHIGTDWGEYETREVFRTKTGAIDIAGGTDAVVAWEYMPTSAHGHIVCIGSGCYDWYSIAGDAGKEYYHANIAKITENAITYLKGK